MNKRWAGFVTAVCCYVVWMAILFWPTEENFFFETLMDLLENAGIQNRVATAVFLPFLPSLMAGIGLLAVRK